MEDAREEARKLRCRWTRTVRLERKAMEGHVSYDIQGEVIRQHLYRSNYEYMLLSASLFFSLYYVQ